MNPVVEYFGNIYRGIKTATIGMRITFKHLFTKAVTIQYPTVKMKLPERARNRLYVNMDDCIGCDQCSMACPVDCISIETIKSTPEDNLGRPPPDRRSASTFPCSTSTLRNAAIADCAFTHVRRNALK